MKQVLMRPEIIRPDIPIDPIGSNGLPKPNLPGDVGYVAAQVRHFKGYDKHTDEKLYTKWRWLKKWIPGFGWAKWMHNLVTDVGEDYIINQIWINNVAGGIGINRIALSTTSLTPAASDTTLSGEITSGTNAGLARIVASTRNHTNGSNTATLSHTFTSSATVGAPGVQSSALFNADSSGTMGHIQNLPSASGAMATSDQITVSWLMTCARP